MSIRPAIFTWTGVSLVPLARFAKLCGQQFYVGQEYRLAELQERSASTHSHYFACVHESWKNLPHGLAERFPSVEHLRKHALINCGFYDERSLVLSSAAEARRVAAFVAPIDEYAVISVAGTVVKIYTAKSQSYQAMGKKEFAESKRAVLEFLAGSIGVDSGTLAENAGRAA